MKYSDDMQSSDGTQITVDTDTTSSAKGGADGISVSMPEENNERCDVASVGTDGAEADAVADKSDGFFELVGIAVKSIAVTVALILLITSILAVTLPLQAMRVFNKLGMTARAVDFGERYITRELKSYDALNPDEAGNYVILRQTEELTNDDFLEALYVCINNSYKLMNDSYRSGDDRTGEYYATRVEKYTRMYLSLSGIADVNRKRSEQNVAAMPLYEMRPMAYSYGHTMITMNYRARTYLGETETMLYNSNGGNVVTTLSERTNTLYGLDNSERNNIIANLDWYVDYIDSIGEYLDVEFLRAGVANDMSAEYTNANGHKMPIWVETAVSALYCGKLSGSEFSLIVSDKGYTDVYNGIVRGGAKNKFATYVKYAVDFTPVSVEERLHQLYWLQTLRANAVRLTYLNYLLYFNRESYGAASFAILDAYDEFLGNVSVDALSGAYIEKLNEYKALYQTV